MTATATSPSHTSGSSRSGRCADRVAPEFDGDPATSSEDPNAAIEAEVGALGAAFLEAAAKGLLLSRTRPADFTDPFRRVIREAMEADPREGAADATLVAVELRRRDVPDAVATLHRILSATPTAANAEFYIDRVRAASRGRRERRLREELRDAPIGPAQDIARSGLDRFLEECALEDAPTLGPLRDRLAAYGAGQIRPRPPIVHSRIDDEGRGVPMLRRGDIVALAGAPGAGKSQATTSLAVVLAIGPEAGAVIRDIEGGGYLFAAEPRDGQRVAVRVVCYESDDAQGDAPDALGRVHRFLVSRDLELPEDLTGGVPVLDIVPALGAAANLRAPAGMALLERLLAPIAAAGHHPVLILDNLTAACPGLKAREDHEMSALVAFFRGLRERFGATIVIVVHTRKAGVDGDRGDPLERMKGAQELAALVSQALLLERPSAPGETPRTRFVHAKFRGVQPVEPFECETPHDDCDFVVASPDSQAPRTLARELRDLVFKLTADADARMHSTEPVSFAVVAQHLYRLRAEESQRRHDRARASGRTRLPKVETVPADPADALRKLLDRRGYGQPGSPGFAEWAREFLGDCDDLPGSGRRGRSFAVRADRTGGSVATQGSLL